MVRTGVRGLRCVMSVLLCAGRQACRRQPERFVPKVVKTTIERMLRMLRHPINGGAISRRALNLAHRFSFGWLSGIQRIAPSNPLRLMTYVVAPLCLLGEWSYLIHFVVSYPTAEILTQTWPIAVAGDSDGIGN